MSDDTGWLNFIYAEEVNRIYGEGTWVDTAGALQDDGFEAKNRIDEIDFTHWLRVYNLNGTVPIYSQIDGIEVQIHRAASKKNRLTDSSLRLSVNSTTLVGDNKASPKVWKDRMGETIIYGSSIDIWNSTLTYSDFNNNNFGLMLSVQNNNRKRTDAKVKYIGIKIYYTSGVLPGVTNIAKINGIPINRIIV